MEDPTKYGVVVTSDDGRVERFVEKPKVACRCLPEHTSRFVYLHQLPKAASWHLTSAALSCPQ